MQLSDFETDINQVLDEVLDGRIDIPWLRGEIERLTARRNRLAPADQARADWSLEQLRDQLAADEADQAWAVNGSGEHPVVRATRIRAAAGFGGGDEAERIARLQQGITEIEALADSIDELHMALAVRQEAWLLRQQIGALRLGSGRSSYRPSGLTPAPTAAQRPPAGTAPGSAQGPVGGSPPGYLSGRSSDPPGWRI